MLESTEKTLAIYSKRGEQGKKLQRVYRQLFKPEMHERAYSQIYANIGATTKGTGEETLDGMSRDRIDNIIEALKTERYRWRPARRTYIEKSNGKKRPLGIPSGDDKLLQSTMKNLLEAYYEPTFSNRSHGFRPGRGCHTALMQTATNHQAVSWFIEGDIKGCFDNIDHDTLLRIMGEKIEDNRFLSLTRKLLKAGYMEDWSYHKTYSGTPQGGTISPLLANIYLDRLDKWVEKELMPKYNRRASRHGRRANPEYNRLSKRKTRAKARGDIQAMKEADKARKNIPSQRTEDEEYRKLEYVRYADDFLLSFAGPKSEAEQIKEEIKDFLKDVLNLDLSEDKTLITHARTKPAKFLGYELRVSQNRHRPTVSGLIKFGVPKEVITKAMQKYTKKDKPVHRGELLNENDLEIIWTYQTEYKGLVNYYQMAHNLSAIGKVGWVTQASLIKTLAAKHNISAKKIAKKHRQVISKDGKQYKVLSATQERKGKKPLSASYGAVSLARNPQPTKLADEKPKPRRNSRTELVKRLSADQCEMCGKKGRVEMHHVRKLKDVNKPGRTKKPLWVHRMAAIRRKTLACCMYCHQAIHDGKHLPKWDLWKDTLESRVP